MQLNLVRKPVREISDRSRRLADRARARSRNRIYEIYEYVHTSGVHQRHARRLAMQVFPELHANVESIGLEMGGQHFLKDAKLFFAMLIPFYRALTFNVCGGESAACNRVVKF